MSDKYPGGLITANAPAGFSVALSGTSSYLSVANNAAFDLPADFTIEMWAYFNVTTDQVLIAKWWTGGTQWVLQFRAAGSDSIANQHWRFFAGNGSQAAVDFQESSTTSVLTSTWYHIALTRSGSSYRIFRNGVQVGTTYTNATAITSTTDPMTIGQFGNAGAGGVNGYLSNVRIVKGTALYTTTFTPPTQLFLVSGTSILTAQSPTIVDNSTNAFTVTPTSATVSNFTPFAAFSGSLVPRSSPQTASGIWTIDEAAYFTTQGLWPTAPDVPQKSLRFNSPDNASLTRTPATASNRKTWTWGGWLKRGKLGSRTILFTGGVAGTNLSIEFTASNEISVYQYSSSAFQFQLVSTMLFRDVSAWYNVVVSFDTTQATSTNRIKVWINGTQVTSFSTASYPSLNTDYIVNSTVAHNVGDCSGASLPFDGYMTEVNFIDGQALEPTAFGAFEGGTGVWSPAPYNGTYGTNGFYLRFLDNSNTTAATLGKDSSPNGNNYTPNNFSVTAGVGNDSLLDTPNRFGTDTGVGGQVGGNYCTFNSLRNEMTLANGNIQATGSNSGAWKAAAGTIGVSSGKWYWEINVLGVNNSSQYSVIGVSNSSAGTSDIYGSPTNSWVYDSRGTKQGNGAGDAGAGTVAYGAAYVAGDTIGVALDMDSGTLTFYKNNTSQGVAFNTSLSGKELFPWVGLYGTSASVYINFGQRPFAYTAPSGFKALVSTNLPTPAIGASNATLASKNMNIALYTGNGTSSATTQAITGVGFQPDLVWIKNRVSVAYHVLTDAVRGVNAILSSNDTLSESTFDAAWRSGNGQLTAFGSDGFTVAAGTVAGGNFNYSGQTYVGWAFKGGNGTVSNTSGTITSTVSANSTAGISVITYTGNGTGGATVGHGLGAAPKMIICKSRTTASNNDWTTYHASIGNVGAVFLNLTNATNTTNLVFWNNTSPTSSVFSIGTNATVNQSSINYVAYAFAEVAGFSKIGSYIGNGSADGPFVYCGFRPRYIFIKNTAGGSWEQYDTARNTYNQANLLLEPNSSGAEATAAGYVLDFVSNGFKIRGTGTGINTNANTLIFAAFAEAPFNYARAR
jgi:hypothetical protein